MPVDECISAEELAQLFHRYHGVLTGCFDGRTATAPWDQVDSHQRRLLIATARLVLSDLAAKQQAGESQAAAENADQEATDRRAFDDEPGNAPLRGIARESNSLTNGNHADPANRRYYAKPGQAEWGC
jgi:hypothetical protein